MIPKSGHRFSDQIMRNWKKVMTGFINYAISHARLTLATLVFLLLAGFVAYNTIPKEAEPDVKVADHLCTAHAARHQPGRRRTPAVAPG